MKKILFTAIIAIITSCVSAQSKTDSASKTTDTTERDGGISFNYTGKHHYKRKDTSYHYSSYPKGYIGITFSRFDLGFAKLIDNGSFTLSPQNQFLRYRASKTSNVGFDVFQMGVRFSSAFKIYLSGGFDWTLIRLEDNITILPNQPALSYKQDDINFSKNRFSSSYLRIPLSFDFRTRQLNHGERLHFVFGPDCGFLLGGMVKQISTELGKQKISDDYNYTTFRYGGFVRIGYGDFGIFAKYYANNMFENSPQQDGLKNFSFGLTAGF